MKRIRKVAILIIAATIAIPILFNACSIQPLYWKPAKQPEFKGVTALNENLTATEKISLRGWYGPEDIVFDSAGNIYTGVHINEEDFSDGRMLKIDHSGKTEVFYNAGSGWLVCILMGGGISLL